jgi:hypothetical protein
MEPEIRPRRSSAHLILVTAIALLAIAAVVSAGAAWQLQNSNTPERLRAVSASSGNVAWASGNKGTVLRTADGGAHWAVLAVPGAEALDFRDIEATSERTAYILSIGAGDKSRIFKTTDAGTTWVQQFVNADPNAFYDAIAFWDEQNGLAVGDPVEGRFTMRHRARPHQCVARNRRRSPREGLALDRPRNDVGGGGDADRRRYAVRRHLLRGLQRPTPRHRRRRRLPEGTGVERQRGGHERWRPHVGRAERCEASRFQIRRRVRPRRQRPRTDRGGPGWHGPVNRRRAHVVRDRRRRVSRGERGPGGQVGLGRR